MAKRRTFLDKRCYVSDQIILKRKLQSTNSLLFCDSFGAAQAGSHCPERRLKTPNRCMNIIIRKLHLSVG